jgi:hypothetical protein
LICETGFFREPLGRQQIADAIALKIRDFDVSFAGQALEIQVGQTKGDPELAREGALRSPAVAIEFAKQYEITLTL